MPAISITELAYQLYQRQLIKFGKFTLHSGLISPIYFDLRNLIVDPTFFSQVIDLYVEALSGLENTFDFIAGPAYTGIPIATLLSQRLNKPMILIRKDAKTHGTGGGSQIVGSVLDPEALNRVLIVDDVITSGASLLETIDILEKAEYRPVECLVLIDRRPVTQRMRTLSNGTFINSVFSVESVLREIINLPGFPSDLKLQILAQSEWFPTFSQKINCVLHPQVRKLLHIIEHKKTRLVLSADSSNPAEILNLIDKLGPEIAVLKIHSDILEFDRDYTETWFYINLKQLASQFQFLILEDRKLADIGSTTALQLKKISKWADLVTAHIISGPGVIQAVRENCNGFGLGLLLIAEIDRKSVV